MRVKGLGSLVLVLCVATPIAYGQSESDKQLIALNKRKVAELVLASSACRTLIREIYSTAAGPRPKADGWGCESSKGKYSIHTSADGAIYVVADNSFLNEGIDNKVITLVPVFGGRPLRWTGKPAPAFDWRCGDKRDLPAGGKMVDKLYLPEMCAGG